MKSFKVLALLTVAFAVAGSSYAGSCCQSKKQCGDKDKAKKEAPKDASKDKSGEAPKK